MTDFMLNMMVFILTGGGLGECIGQSVRGSSITSAAITSAVITSAVITSAVITSAVITSAVITSAVTQNVPAHRSRLVRKIYNHKQSLRFRWKSSCDGESACGLSLTVRLNITLAVAILEVVLRGRGVRAGRCADGGVFRHPRGD